MTDADCRHIAELSLLAHRAMDRAVAADEAGDPDTARWWHAEFTRWNQRRGRWFDANRDRLAGYRVELDDVPEELRGGAQE